MKLKELTLDDYKGFVNFTTTFDEHSPITTFIGQNGVGKSNLIEAIISIFRMLDLGNNDKTDFSYSLIYECRGHEIQVRFDANEPSRSLVYIDGAKKSFTFLKNNANEYLPLNVFAYYSGTNWRVEELFVKHQTHFYKRLTEGDDSLLRRFFYCRDVHSFFVLLAFLVDDDPACKKLLEKLDIKNLESVLFCLKKPYWFKNKPSEIMLNEGDSRFWYSRGIVKDFLADLWNYSIAPIDNKERKNIDFRGRSEQQDRLYMFIPNEEALRGFASGYSDTTSFFKNIESTYIADILESVNVTVTLKNGQELTFDKLSEGERQLLTVLGLMKFTRDDESLFLLDEPDTHLNPRWKLDYFDQIKSILDHQIEGSNKSAWDSSQVMLTTHDPLMLTSLRADQVRVLTEGAEGKSSDIPDEDPLNLGVEAIIQSDLYGIRTSLDKEIQHKIDLRNRLLSIQGGGEDVSESLLKINNELDAIGFSQAHPNPYFSNFAKAISRNPKFRRPELSADEYKMVQALSDELLQKVIDEEAGDDKS
ncbi:TPA: AAA family ATPase [Vibrio parahaemolyticus]|uniref:AAA family ATPase n=1 Tax=Vibrio parahaemolyticus TaxID=670 RepID=UPI00040FC808|nr:ATP-binding protein [Vibrio parahaemolyticus]EJG2371829.1 AAA family ATPase [Vibrio parahaemolyticus]TOD41903.1 AAA family ATPase [Vibrio parahaemolyticus]TPA08894.1 AAA family ATPase [Vibrio parahaemolyticus]HBC3602921.1 AAA family ATPase [Vibrio parahaemolyticus]HCG5934731.1 AAA family ATPase [Vibrio parahaemolyticus]